MASTICLGIEEIYGLHSMILGHYRRNVPYSDIFDAGRDWFKNHDSAAGGSTLQDLTLACDGPPGLPTVTATNYTQN
jgi:hypothetical protein